MSNTLKHAIKDYYLDFELSENQLNALRSSLSEPEPKDRPLSWLSIQWLRPASVGFAVALVLSLSFYFTNLKPLHNRIADEVAYNHLKAMPSEVLTNDYQVINEALDRLDFNVKPSQILASNYQVLGARYCTVQGKVAAQLKLMDPSTGEEFTLYQFNAVNFDELNESAIEIQETEVLVKIWREGDVGFALASSNKK